MSSTALEKQTEIHLIFFFRFELSLSLFKFTRKITTKSVIKLVAFVVQRSIQQEKKKKLFKENKSVVRLIAVKCKLTINHRQRCVRLSYSVRLLVSPTSIESLGRFPTFAHYFSFVFQPWIASAILTWSQKLIRAQRFWMFGRWTIRGSGRFHFIWLCRILRANDKKKDLKSCGAHETLLRFKLFVIWIAGWDKCTKTFQLQIILPCFFFFSILFQIFFLSLRFLLHSLIH